MMLAKQSADVMEAANTAKQATAAAADAMARAEAVAEGMPDQELKWKQAIEEEANNRMTDAGFVRTGVWLLWARGWWCAQRGLTRCRFCCAPTITCADASPD